MGQIPRRADIVNITNANPCEVTTAENHEFITGDFVRLTDLNGAMPTPRGEDPINNYRFRITVTGLTTFIIRNPITNIAIDSTNYPPYVTGGFCNLVQTNFYYYNDDENQG